MNKKLLYILLALVLLSCKHKPTFKDEMDKADTEIRLAFRSDSMNVDFITTEIKETDDYGFYCGMVNELETQYGTYYTSYPVDEMIEHIDEVRNQIIEVLRAEYNYRRALKVEEISQKYLKGEIELK